MAIIEITRDQAAHVSGGAKPSAQLTALNNACREMPASATVTISLTVAAQLGISTTNSSNSQQITITTTCGDVTKAYAAVKAAPAPGRSASGTVGTGFFAGGDLFRIYDGSSC